MSSISINYLDELALIGVDEAYPSNGDYVLQRDLDFNVDASYLDAATNKPTYTTGTGWLPLCSATPYFDGTFDGQGFTISNLFIDRGATDNVGLFSRIAGTVHDLSLAGVNVTAGTNSGPFAGRIDSNGEINNCVAVSGTMAGTANIGGIIGYAELGKICFCNVTLTSVQGSVNRVGGVTGRAESASIIEDCETDCGVVSNYSLAGGIGGDMNGPQIRRCIARGAVTGYGDVGGLVGDGRGATIVIEDCSAYGNVESTGGTYTGGFAGRSTGEITRCRSFGDVVSSRVTTAEVGGFIGRCSAIIIQSYCEGGVTAHGPMAGGFVGYRHLGPITDCYTWSAVSGTTEVGGFAGDVVGATEITNCYSVGAPSGSANVGGFCGAAAITAAIVHCFYDSTTSGQSDTGKGTPLPTADMQLLVTFDAVGWNIAHVPQGGRNGEYIWNITNGVTYPLLPWGIILDLGWEVGDVIVLRPDSDNPIRVEIIGVPDEDNPDAYDWELLDELPEGVTLEELIEEGDWALAKRAISGLHHLEGRTVHILADGFVHPPGVVLNGEIELEEPAVIVQIGLPYESLLELQPVPTGKDSDRERPKRITKIIAEIESSKRMVAGTIRSPLIGGGIIVHDRENPSVAWDAVSVEQGYTGYRPAVKGIASLRTPSNWDADGVVQIKQVDPLPLSLLAISREVGAGGS